jgi:hypothetical protein
MNTRWKKMAFIYELVGMLIIAFFVIKIITIYDSRIYYRNLEQINAYLNNSMEIKIAIPKENKHEDNVKRNRHYEGISFFSKEYNKYFIISFIIHRYPNNDTRLTNDAEMEVRKLTKTIDKGNVEIIATVNKNQFENKNYGTSSNPVPIFIFSLRKYNGEKYTENSISLNYKQEINYYLLNVISKQEYFELFGVNRKGFLF